MARKETGIYNMSSARTKLANMYKDQPSTPRKVIKQAPGGASLKPSTTGVGPVPESGIVNMGRQQTDREKFYGVSAGGDIDAGMRRTLGFPQGMVNPRLTDGSYGPPMQMMTGQVPEGTRDPYGNIFKGGKWVKDLRVKQ